MAQKTAFITISGKPNVGKSTLLNTLLGEKVAIVSKKPQTTRNKIIGILNEDDCQIIFTDTPGMHKSKNKLDEFMQKNIDKAKQGVDVTLLVLDGLKAFTKERMDFVAQNDKKNTILVVNKIDETSFEKLYPKLVPFNELKNIKHIIPISAKKGKNVDVLLKAIKEYLPSGIKYFPDDIYTDKSERFLVAETIREKALYLLQDEIPHGIAIDILKYNEGENVYTIDADIVCEKASHKQIIIGKNGEMLKEIGIKSREEIEKLVGKKVMLNLYVKVRANWRNNNLYIKDLGYELNEWD